MNSIRLSEIELETAPKALPSKVLAVLAAKDRGDLLKMLDLWFNIAKEAPESEWSETWRYNELSDGLWRVTVREGW